ncbi:MAG: flippase, partial [Lachnospiraceae bacterium]|nr:flippase [Lachnospiraceae bacterium]
AQREIAYHQTDVYKRSRIFWEVFLLRFLCTCVNLVVLYCIIFNSDDKRVYIAQSLYVISVIFYISWFFQGLEEFGKIVFRNTIIKLISVALIFLLVKSENDLMVYIMILAGLTALGNLLIMPYLVKYIVSVPLKELRIFRNFKLILQLFIPQIAIQSYTVLDKIMLGILINSNAENGYYEQAEKIVRLSLTIITALGTVMLPRFAKVYAEGKTDEMKGYLYKSYRFIWLLACPMVMGLVLISGNFVPWFFGEGYDKVVPLLRIFSLLILAIGISNVTGVQYLVATKRQVFYTISVFVGAFINMALNSILILKLQSFGAAIASVAAETSIAVMQLLYIRKEIELKKVLGPVWKYALCALCMGAVMWGTGRNLGSSPFYTAFLVGIGGGVYLLLLLLLRDQMVCEVLQKVKERFGKGN